MVTCRTYSPYGAWELKRHYQRNLLIANGLTILLVIVAVTVPSLLTGDSKVVAGDGQPVWRPPVETRMTPQRPMKPVPEDLGIAIRKPDKPVVTDAVGWNLTPVADELDPDNNRVLADQDELRGLIDGRGGAIDTGAGEWGGQPLTPQPPAYPDIDSFVPVEIEPRMVFEFKPDYPRLAKQAGIEGKVWIKALVDVDGSVKDVVVAKSSESELLDRAALDAARKNRFSPAIQNKQPIPVWVTYAVEFRLDK